MNSSNIYVFILAAAMMTYAVRVLPLTLIRKPIRSRFIRSFLFYVPYVTLAVMTFPAIIGATNTKAAGIAALLVGIFVAWKGQSLIKTAASCTLVAFLVELF
ncbi:MAG: AzlD domain-containing protein [Oscillospiraceae bacterium]|nr:AzlD domain-containing protein [Oscillospiraceae bacterium]